MHYPPIDFKGGKKPKGGEIEIFFVEGVNEMGQRSLLKPSSAFFINAKIKISNLWPDNA